MRFVRAHHTPMRSGSASSAKSFVPTDTYNYLQAGGMRCIGINARLETVEETLDLMVDRGGGATRTDKAMRSVAEENEPVKSELWNGRLCVCV